MEATEKVKLDPGLPPFNQFCLDGMYAIEKIMARMTEKGTNIHELMSFICVVWASHAANIMRTYMPTINIDEFRLNMMMIAGDSLDKMLAPINIPDRKDMQ